MDICTSNRVRVSGAMCGRCTDVVGGSIVPEGNGGGWPGGSGFCRRSDDGEPAAPGTQDAGKMKVQPVDAEQGRNRIGWSREQHLGALCASTCLSALQMRKIRSHKHDS